MKHVCLVLFAALLACHGATMPGPGLLPAAVGRARWRPPIRWAAPRGGIVTAG